MDFIGIITARGGSKRIPHKNIKEFCGKPIIAYSIEAAIESRIFSEIMVSTDSPEIAEIAKHYGANVPFLRSEKTSNDIATTSDVISEVLEKYNELGKRFSAFCCIYPTAPLIMPERLREAAKLLENENAFSVTPVVKFSFPPQRGFVIKSNLLSMPLPQYKNTRSQDIEPIYHDAGQFYFVKTDAFLLEKSVITSKSIPLVLQEEEVQDIDNMEDWILAELKYKIRRRDDETLG